MASIFFLCGVFQFLLRVEEIVLCLAQIFVSNPALTLFVSFLGHQVLKLLVLLLQHRFHLAVSTCEPINFLLKHLTLVGLPLNRTFHLIDLELALADLILDLLKLLLKVRNCVLLQANLALSLSDLVLIALNHQVLGLATVLGHISSLYL